MFSLIKSKTRLMRFIFYVIFLLIIFGSIYYIYNEKHVTSYPTTQAITLPNGQTALVKVNGSYLIKEKKKTKKNIRSSDEAFPFTIKNSKENIGEITVTIRKIDNGDFFVFTRLQNKTKKPISASIQYNYEGNLHSELTSFDRKEINHEHDHVFGVDPTTYPIGVLQIKDFQNEKASMMISKNYVSKQLVKKYSNKDSSKIRKLESENNGLAINQNNRGLDVNLPLYSTGEDISENWVVISQQMLFKNSKDINDLIDRSTKEYRSTNKWYTADGPYSKLPWSIEPSEKLGYGRNLAQFRDNAALAAYKERKDRYYYDLIINSVTDLYNFKGNKKGLWLTEYTSTWLKNAYGIQAPYTDTRHNEKIALFLKNAGDLLNISELETANLLYADFLVDQSKNGNTLQIKNGGYLITDYYSPSQTKKTHVSLNHSLGEMNFLLDSYRQTKNKEYLKVAKQMRLGIENLGDSWLRKDGDTWYQVNGDLTFEGRDYPLLTLEDLLNSQNQWKKVGEERSKVFDHLIRSKATYLVHSNTTILLSDVEKLKIQGFGDIIAGYKNISKY